MPQIPVGQLMNGFTVCQIAQALGGAQTESRREGAKMPEDFFFEKKTQFVYVSETRGVCVVVTWGGPGLVIYIEFADLSGPIS